MFLSMPPVVVIVAEEGVTVWPSGPLDMVPEPLASASFGEIIRHENSQAISQTS